MEDKYRTTLLAIGAQHPAWSKDKDSLVDIFNLITVAARTAVGAEGNDDDERADWCSSELDRVNAE